MGFVNEISANGDGKTIDHERDVTLVYVTSNRGERYDFILTVEGHEVYFSALRSTIATTGKHANINWEIVKIDLNDFSLLSILKIKKLIKEALIAHGSFCSTNLVDKVTVKFNLLKGF